ncbi:S8 family serine peptidase [Kitasatospora sp. NPDC048365]|uniref:S8 family serine peptidase n=1 Tax=Kitasatospora sp. NPDC048365 TaxID=3364050 RepID=UPI00371802DA
MKRTAILAGVVLAAVTGVGAAPAATAAPAESESGYVVVLKDGAQVDPTAVAHGVKGLRLGSVYRSALTGFSAKLTPSAVAQLRANPAVKYVEASATGHADAQTTPNGTSRTFAAGNTGLKVGDGLDQRVDVDVAVIDSGTDYYHPDLNVVRRVNCVGVTSCVENAGYDDNGHGSNVGGIIGGLDNGIGYVGVAPGARLWSVKTLNSEGSGTTEEIVNGIDWVTAHADEIEVANISIGFDGTEQAVVDAVNRAIAKGIVIVVSAGNDHRDVSNQSPANVPDAITVSSVSDADGKAGGLGNFAWCNKNNTNKDDSLSNFSNFGRGVDIAAPGDCIQSAFKNGGWSNYSGTSQAAPHVAGAAAWLTRGGNRPHDRAGVLAVRDRLVAAGNSNWTDNSGDGVKEPLLDLHDPALFPAGGTAGPDATAVASCDNTGKSCTLDASLSSGTGLSYSWNFGDGTTGTGAKPVHTYASYGVYPARVTVTDSSGRTSGNTVYVRATDPAANEKPVASFTGFCTAAAWCGFDATNAYDPDGAIASYRWDFGDGSAAATELKPSHTYPDRTATYTARLTVTDGKGATGTATTTVSCVKQTYITFCSTS